MDILSVKKYISSVLKVSMKVKEIDIPSDLPVYFSRSYKLYLAKIESLEFLVVLAISHDVNKLKVLKKRFAMIEDKLKVNLPYVYVCENLDWYMTNQLIKSGMSLIVPNRQIYLPFLACVLVSKFGPLGIERKKLSPATQYVLIELMEREGDVFTLSDFSDINLSKMSVSRALNELVEFDLLVAEKKGKAKFWKVLMSKRELWESSLHLLFNPIMKTVHIKYKQGESTDAFFLQAGETALAQKSLLSEPERDQYACFNRTFLSRQDEFEKTSKNDEGGLILQIWKHEIPVLEGKIHPLALYLSLIDIDDDRINESMEIMLNDYWKE